MCTWPPPAAAITRAAARTRSSADGVAGCPVVGVDHELQGPARPAPRHLGVADRMLVAVLPGDQAGEAALGRPGPDPARRARPGRHGRRPHWRASSRSANGRRRHRCPGGSLPRCGAPQAGVPLADRLPRSDPGLPGRAGTLTLASMAGPRTPKGRAREAAARLAVEYPGTAQELCALDFNNPFQLLVATVLSAQTTDERVNMVTPDGVRPLPDAGRSGRGRPGRAGGDSSTPPGSSVPRRRASSGSGRALDERFGGEVPAAIEDLVTPAGGGPQDGQRGAERRLRAARPAGRHPRDPADPTARPHRVHRPGPDRDATSTPCCPPREWGAFSLRLILHGRRVCIARRPRCADCVLADFCPSSQVPMPLDRVGTHPTGQDAAARRPPGDVGRRRATRPDARSRRRNPPAPIARPRVRTDARLARPSPPAG